MSKEDFFYKESKTSSKMKKIPKLKEKNRWRTIKIVGTQENAVGASGKCQILCKNLQKLSKNEKFHKILQENYIFCAKTALARANAGVRQRLTVFFALARQRLICRLQCFLRAPTAYEHPYEILK